MALRELGTHRQKIESRPVSPTMYQAKISTNQRSKCYTRNNLQGDKTGKVVEGRGVGKDFLNKTPMAQEIATKNR